MRVGDRKNSFCFYSQERARDVAESGMDKELTKLKSLITVRFFLEDYLDCIDLR